YPVRSRTDDHAGRHRLCDRPGRYRGQIASLTLQRVGQQGSGMSDIRITVAHSPDSDDAFMFFGLASGNVDTGGIVVDQVLSDIETLNRAAFEGRYEVTAVSFHAYAHLVDKYALLPHGASMGDKYGPIVVAPAISPEDRGRSGGDA